jgi:hypothetical protein
MIQWMLGIARSDRIRNEYIRGTVKMNENDTRIKSSTLIWRFPRESMVKYT